MTKINKFILEKTESLLVYCFSDQHYELLKYMEILRGSESYPMKIEFLPQFLLQKFCDQNQENGYNEHKYFSNELNSAKTLKVRVNQELFSNEKLAKVLSEFELRFNEWIACLTILYDLNFLKKTNGFALMSRGFSDIINVLIEPDHIFSFAQPERVKGGAKPKYSTPTETLYVSSFLSQPLRINFISKYSVFILISAYMFKKVTNLK